MDMSDRELRQYIKQIGDRKLGVKLKFSQEQNRAIVALKANQDVIHTFHQICGLYRYWNKYGAKDRVEDLRQFVESGEWKNHPILKNGA